MSTLTLNGWPTLSEVAGRMDPGGVFVPITNVLLEANPMIGDIPWFEGNQATGHLIQRTETALPSAEYRVANRGTAVTKGKTAQYLESCGVLESISSIDSLLVDQNGGLDWRLSEDMIKLGSIPQGFATEVLYASALSDPEGIHGLAPRFQNKTGYDSSSQVVAGTNAGDNCYSAWFITWAPRMAYGIYPKGTPAGLQSEDMGKQRSEDSNGLVHYRYETMYRWNVGIAVEDFRYLVRVQWDVDDPEMAEDERGLLKLLSKGMFKLFRIDARTRLYMNRETLILLDAQLMANENRQMQFIGIEGGKTLADPANMGGERVPHFRGIPIRVSDASVAETAVTA